MSRNLSPFAALIGACVVMLSNPAFAEDIYIAQTAQGLDSGANAASAHAVTWFNTSGNWGAGAGKIGPGDTVHLCGTFNAPAGTANYLQFQGGGIAGNPITLLFEPNAVIQAPYWSGTAINLDGFSFITVDGGINGLIQATQNGTSLANQQDGGTGIISNGGNNPGGDNLIIKNVTVANIYNHSYDPSDNNGEGTGGISVTGGNNIVIASNTVHDAKWCVGYAIPGGTTYSNVAIYGNTIYHADHGILIGDGNSDATLSGIIIHHNTIYDGYVWDDTANNNHHDAVHTWSVHSGSSFSGLKIYDNYMYGNWGFGFNAFLFSEGVQNGAQYFNNVMVDQSTVSHNGAGYIGLENDSIIVANNTVVGPGTAMNFYGKNVTAENNVVANAFGAIAFPAGSSWAVVDHNDYYNIGNAGWCLGSFAGWQSYSGCDSNSMVADPKLTGSYQLQQGSPAIGAGANLTSLGIAELNKDINGSPRPASGAWDIGAYVYQVSGNHTPTCSITSPANSASFTAPASVTINANASDSDGSVTNVEFYQGANKLGSDTTSPYSYTWTSVSAGSYSLTAKAYDNLGASTVSAPVSITVTSAASGGTTYYVDKNNAQSSDSNPGTASLPWKTIQKAANTMVAGETAIVVAGTYNETITTTRSGSSGNRIKFQASGAVTTGTWNILHDYITVDGFTVLDGGTIYTSNRDGSNGSYCELLNNHINNGSMGMVYKSNPTGCLIKGNHLTVTSGPGSDFTQINVWGTSNLVENNEIGPAQDIDAFRFFGHENIIRSNYVHDVTLSSGSTAHMDMFQTFGDNGDACYNYVIENNLCVNSSGQMFNLEETGANIHDVTFRNNVWAHFGENGNIKMPNVFFYNNTFYDTGFFYNSAMNSTGTVFKNNIFIGLKGWYNNTAYSPTGAGGNLFRSDVGCIWTIQYNFFSQLDGTALTGFDNQTGGINGGAINFVNAAANDYRLLGNSPAVNAGATLTGFNYDIAGTTRPQGAAWDMGAYEYVSGGGDQAPACNITSPTSGSSFAPPASITVSASASDSDGSVTNVEFYQGAVKIGSDNTAPYSFVWTNVSAGSYSLTVKAFDDLGASTVSVPVGITVATPPAGWENHAFASQNGNFTAEFDATPSQAGLDTVIALSAGAAGAYSDLACIMRFTDTNTIDARNGADYTAQSVINYSPGTSYHVKFVVNVPQHIYDIYVTPQGGSQTLLGQNYAFRTEQNTVSGLANWVKYDSAGTSSVTNFTIGTTNPPSVGMLSGAGAAGTSSTVNLTAEGTDDWAHWGFNGTSIDHKSVSGVAVNNITETHVGSPQQYANNANGYSWSDGTPTVNAVANTTGIYVVNAGNSFTITVPADTTARIVKVYVGGWKSAGTLTAHLSDDSAADYTDSSFSNLTASYYAVYTITYKAGATNQNLTVNWRMVSGPAGGNVTLQAATLQVGGSSAEVIRFVQAGLSAGSTGCSFTWNGATGASATNSFKVYRCTNLMAGNWQLVAPNIARSGTGTNIWTDTNVFPQAFYRVATPNQ